MLLKRVFSVFLVFSTVPVTAWAGCGFGWPTGFLGCGPHLGLGPGYPGLYPPSYVYPPWLQYPWIPQPPVAVQPVVVVPSPPPQVYIVPEQPAAPVQNAAASSSEPYGAADARDEVARARRLYPHGIPAVDYVWLPGQAVVRLHPAHDRK